jgi:serine/threonine protein kinase
MPGDLRAFGYESLQVIGTGHFGSVYLVRRLDGSSHTLVCKLVAVENLNEKDRGLAEQEVSLLQRLCHKNIVRFEDCFRIDPGNAIALVMEYCDGGDVRGIIRRQAKLGMHLHEPQVMQWFGEILDGLSYMHDQRVIHRDLKTSNLFLKGPPPYRCLIGDFGISRVLEETLAAAQTVIGTPFYLCPEVCKKQSYSYKSDMWSLGACLYEMTMLRMAFKSSNLIELVDRIVNDSFDPMDSGIYSDHVSRIVSILLTKDPNGRPSANELMQDEYVRIFVQGYADLMLPSPERQSCRPATLRGRRNVPLSHFAEVAPAPPTDVEVGLVTAVEELYREVTPFPDAASLLPGRVTMKPALVGINTLPPPKFTVMK